MNIHTYIARNNLMDMEKRVCIEPVELRASKKGSGPGVLVGYAAKFNKMSVNLGGFTERLAAGCFDDVLGDDVRCLRNHDDDNLLGRTANGTLELTQNSLGLKYEVELPNTQVGRDTAELVQRGDMSGSSFQFEIVPGDEGADWDFKSSAMPIRTVKRVARLYDVAPVTNPAYVDTEVNMRSVRAAMEQWNELQAEIVRVSLSLARARLRLAAASYF